MVSKLGITHLQTILLIDLIIVSAAAGGYFYVSNLPGPQLTDSQVQLLSLQATPLTVIVGEPVTVSMNVSTVSGASGKYVAILMVDGAQAQSQAVELQPAENKEIQFIITDAAEGTHIASIGSLEASFAVAGKLAYSDLVINRTEAAAGEPVGIALKVTNKVQDIESYSLTLKINNLDVETKSGQLSAASSTTVLFEVTEQAEGTYQIQVAGLIANFTVNPYAPPAKAAEFAVTDLSVTPQVTQQGKPVTVSAQVINVGEVRGTYTATLLVNGQSAGNKNLDLTGGQTTLVQFTISEANNGNYQIQIANQTATLTIQDPSKITLSNFAVTPNEVWSGQTIRVTVKATNAGTSPSSLELVLTIDGEVNQTQTINLAQGTFIPVSFSFNAPALTGGNIAHHTIDLNGIAGSFDVSKLNYHTLSVAVSPSGDAKFSLVLPSGVSEEHTTPYGALLPAGVYSVIMPNADPTGKVTFDRWNDGSRTSTTKTFSLNSRVDLIAYYLGGSSCPSLYTWNGAGYSYVTDVSNHGWLGYINYINHDASIVYYRNNPWDYVPLNSSALKATNGYFNLTLLQRWNEVFYTDQAYLMVVDHPANVKVSSTMVEQYLDPQYMGNIYTIGNPQTPVSAINQLGQNVLSEISQVDGVFTSGTHGIQSPAWNYINWNTITLNLGNLAGAKQIKLVVTAKVDWGNPDDYTTWLNKFFAQSVPDGTQVTPPPFMQVKDANGNWIRVPQSRDFPLPPDADTRTYVVDLTGLFPTNNYSLKINNFWNVTFDYIAVDTTPQQAITVQRINPQAYLYQQTSAGTDAATGAFTKYGNVTELVQTFDDKFVIGRQGDALSLQFPIANLNASASGMVRDYFLFEATWFKDITGNWGFGFDFTSEPLPFSTMSGFPYLPSENYPNDTAHQNYLNDWNTRIITPSAPASQNSFATALPLAVLITALIYATFKSLSRAFVNAKRRKSHFTCRSCLKSLTHTLLH
jgi:hypothetical protein